MPKKDWLEEWEKKPEWLRSWTEKIIFAVHYNNQSGGKNKVADLLKKMLNEHDTPKE